MPLDIFLGSFYGIDSLIDFAIVLVAALVSYQSHRIYKLLGEKNYRFFSWAFFSIAVAVFFKIISNLTIVHKAVIKSPNFILLITHEFQEMQLLNFASFIFYKVFFLLGFLILFLIITKTNKKEDIFLLVYFGIISVLFSVYFNFVFHLTLIILLITLTAYFYQNNKKVRSKNSYLVFSAFVFILASQIIELFYGLHPLVYLVGEILIFIGFLVLLLNHTSIKNGRKKNEIGSNQRPLRRSEK
jgi:hypothetical protein